MNLRHQSRRRFLQYTAAGAAGLTLMGSARRVAAQDGTATPTASGTPGALGDPATRTGDYADVNGAHIFYEDDGDGPPMLLLHGYPLSGALFSRNRDALTQSYRVITVDHRGYGKSVTPGTPDTISVYAQDALAVLDKLGIDKAIIGGHSMGGPITLEMYKQAPDRFTGMILIDTNAAAASLIEAGLWQGFTDEVQQNGVGPTFINNLIKNMLTGKTQQEQPDQVDYLTRIMQNCSREGAIGGAMALKNRDDYTMLLSQITVPTLVFVGVDDQLYPVSISQTIQKAIPGASLATIPGGAHAAIFEVPDQSSKAILDWAAKIG